LASDEVSYVSSGPGPRPAKLTVMHAYVRDIMTAGVVTVRAGTSYRDMVAMVRRHRVSGLPVIDDDGKVIGVVSETDLLAPEAADPGHGVHPAPRTWLPHRTLAGAPGSVVLGQNIVDQVRHLEGVVAVHDHFTYPGP